MPVHSTLVKPTLAPGQVLNGVMVHGIFKEKPIFIRPVEEICDVGISSTKRSLETSNEDEDRVETPKAKVTLSFRLSTFWLFFSIIRELIIRQYLFDPVFKGGVGGGGGT